MNKAYLSLSILTAALLSVPAVAEDEMKDGTDAGQQPAKMEKRHQELVRRFDKDGDGKLSEDEKAAARAEMRTENGPRKENRKKLLKRFDKDGDGKLSEEEKAEAKKAADKFNENRAELIKRFDKDGDGVLNDEERAAAKKAGEERMKKRKKDQ